MGESNVNDESPVTGKNGVVWHGHFATNEDKVRDYRKMLKQLELFQEKAYRILESY